MAPISHQRSHLMKPSTLCVSTLTTADQCSPRTEHPLAEPQIPSCHSQPLPSSHFRLPQIKAVLAVVTFPALKHYKTY